MIAHAQNSASIAGRITDPSGAVVPSATVTAREVNTGLTRSAVSNAEGYYILPLLRAAEYSLTIEAAGFRRQAQEGLTLKVDQTATVNVALELGATADAVTVQSTASQVDVQTPTLKQVVEEKRINELPLNGRNAATLALLVAGVSESPSDGATQCCDKTMPGAVSYSTNGSRQNQINFRLDGVDNMDAYTNVNQPFPFPDVLQEFSVQTSNYGAELGSQAGGAVNVVTKSGTNGFHGNAFGYLRNAVLNARNFFSPTRDQLKRSQFGGTIGGPVVKNRTFFFFGYQGTETRNTQTAGSSVIPTQANITGDFSALLNANNPANTLGRVVQIFDPVTKVPYAGNMVPVSQFDPAAIKMLKFIPEIAGATGAGRVQFARPIRNDTQSFFARVDDSLSPHDRITGRYYAEDYDEASTYDGRSLLTLSPQANTRSQNLLAQETHIFKPNLINDFRFGYSRVYSIRERPRVPGATSTDVGIASRFIPDPGDTFGVAVNGFFSVSNTSKLFINRNSFTFNNDVKWVSGRHSISFGGMLQKSDVDLALPDSVPFMQFANDQTGYAITSFLLGAPFLFVQSSEQARVNAGWFPSLFFQDDIRYSPRLTLSVGLRWDPYLTWGSPTNQVRLFSPADHAAGKRSTVFVNAPPGLSYAGDPGFPKNGAPSDYNNFAPRLGFAYDLTGDAKTSLRGGAGVFYNQRPPAITFNAFQGIYPWSTSVTINVPKGRLSDPLVGETTIPKGVANPSRDVAFPAVTNISTLAAGQKSASPTTYQWNLTLERQLAANTLLRLSHVGSHTNHLETPVEINPAIFIPGSTKTVQERRVLPDIGSVRQTSQEVNSYYNSLQIGIEKRLSRGNSFLNQITLLSSYTYAKGMDTFPQGADPTGNTGGSDVSPLSFYDPGRHDLDYGPTRFDRKHRFVASYLWDLPKLKGQYRVLQMIAGDWQATGIFQVQSGLSFTPLAGQDRSQTSLNQDRAQYLGGDPFGKGGCRPGEAPCVDFLNTAAFGLPALGSAGNVGKGALRGPNYWNADMGFLKNIALTERMRLQARLEFFNIFNTTALIPLPGQTNFSFAAAGFGAIRSAGDPRIGQVSLKFFF